MKGVKWVKEDEERENVFWPTEEMKKKANMSDPSIYERAGKDPVAFWAKLAEEGLEWYEKWDKAYEEKPFDFNWFLGGRINAAYNALDRHVKSGGGDKIALIWVPEPLEEEKKVFTYNDLYLEVNKFANVLKKLGVKKGDPVGVYLPMIPEVVITMLACARIGAPHSVVFSAFSGESLKDRLQDNESRVLVTVDGYYRRGKQINLKAHADIGVEDTRVEHVILVKRANLDVELSERDQWWHELMQESESYCEPESMGSNEMLFILYTSGTTGKPKGVMHDTGGYLTQAYWTTKWDFDLQEGDVFWCTADVGWVTGHTYGCYGPLTVGSTMLMYEGAPNYPDPGRWWKIVDENNVTVFYTAPTAVRMFLEYGDELPKKYDLSTLRILGTVGEPINKKAWLWYFNVIGGGRCPVIDTWWQTETGGTLINSLPGIGPFIPTVAGRSFPGTRHIVLDEEGVELPVGERGYLVQKPPFAPGMLRGVYKNPEKYKKTYWSKFGPNIYYTSDGAKVNEDGTIRLTGRVDDVMKVAGHRLSTAELEDAIDEHYLVRECAVVSKPDKIKWEVPVAFILLKDYSKASEELKKELIKHVDKMIGPTARPADIYFVEDVPKTRSGKIMRRILKGLVRGEENLGNLTTLMNPECVEKLKEKVGYKITN